MGSNTLEFDANSELGQEILRLSQKKDPVSQVRLAALLNERGSEGDFVSAGDQRPPSAASVRIGRAICPYRVTEHVMVIEGALPGPLCERLIECAEANCRWSESTQVSEVDSSSYSNANRTSKGQRVKPAFFGEGVCSELTDLLHEASRFYGYYNPHATWRSSSGWEILRYQEGDRFGEHVDGVQGTWTGSRSLTLLAYLNEVEEGGETAFRAPGPELTIAPARGRLVLSPPFWTHPHEGLPPTKGTKYVVLGWMTS